MNQIATTDNAGLRPISGQDLRTQAGVINDVLKTVMQHNVHYGKIPGTNSPSLYKPGAEKIMATFRLSADPEVEDLSDGDQVRYRVKVRLVSPTGHFVGAGVGECSTSEEKYKWRNVVCPEEFEDTPETRRRKKWKRGWDGKPASQIMQIRTEPADLANTVLKMAKKRALVDAVLTATAASDIFTQDIEDLPPEYLGTAADPQEGQQGAQDLLVDETQVKALRGALSAKGIPEAEACKRAGIDTLESLPANRFQALMNTVNKATKRSAT